MKLSKILSLSLVALLAVACGSGNNEAFAHNTRYEAPELNRINTVLLKRRTRGEPDNYKETCLFLNESFRDMNTCMINVQTEMRIQGVQVTDQKAQFSLLEGATDLRDNQSFDDGAFTSDTIRAQSYRHNGRQPWYSVGDIWVLKKSNSNMNVELKFKIIEINEDSILIDYIVTHYSH